MIPESIHDVEFRDYFEQGAEKLTEDEMKEMTRDHKGENYKDAELTNTEKLTFKRILTKVVSLRRKKDANQFHENLE